MFSWIPKIHAPFLQEALSKIASEYAGISLKTGQAVLMDTPPSPLYAKELQVLAVPFTSPKLTELRERLTALLSPLAEADTQVGSELHKLWRFGWQRDISSLLRLYSSNTRKKMVTLSAMQKEICEEYPDGFGDLKVIGLSIRANSATGEGHDFAINIPFADQPAPDTSLVSTAMRA